VPWEFEGVSFDILLRGAPVAGRQRHRGREPLRPALPSFGEIQCLAHSAIEVIRLQRSSVLRDEFLLPSVHPLVRFGTAYRLTTVRNLHRERRGSKLQECPPKASGGLGTEGRLVRGGKVFAGPLTKRPLRVETRPGTLPHILLPKPRMAGGEKVQGDDIDDGRERQPASGVGLVAGASEGRQMRKSLKQVCMLSVSIGVAWELFLGSWASGQEGAGERAC